MTKTYRVLLGIALIALAGLLVGTSAANRPAVAADGDPSAYQNVRTDLNTATRDELCALPGIGATTADKIIAYRDANGSFRSADELLRVDGIGDATLARLRAWIWVSPEE